MVSTNKRPHRRGPIFLSIGISLAIHVVGIYLILKNPLILERAFQSFKGSDPDEIACVSANAYDPELDNLVVVEAPPFEADSSLDDSKPSTNSLSLSTLKNLDVFEESSRNTVALEEQIPQLVTFQVDHPKIISHLNWNITDFLPKQDAKGSNEVQPEIDVQSHQLFPAQFAKSKLQPSKIIQEPSFSDPLALHYSYPTPIDELSLSNEDKLKLARGYTLPSNQHDHRLSSVAEHFDTLPTLTISSESDYAKSLVQNPSKERSFLDEMKSRLPVIELAESDDRPLLLNTSTANISTPYSPRELIYHEKKLVKEKISFEIPQPEFEIKQLSDQNQALEISAKCEEKSIDIESEIAAFEPGDANRDTTHQLNIDNNINIPFSMALSRVAMAHLDPPLLEIPDEDFITQNQLFYTPITTDKTAVENKRAQLVPTELAENMQPASPPEIEAVPLVTTAQTMPVSSSVDEYLYSQAQTPGNKHEDFAFSTNLLLPMFHFSQQQETTFTRMQPEKSLEKLTFDIDQTQQLLTEKFQKDVGPSLPSKLKLAKNHSGLVGSKEQSELSIRDARSNNERARLTRYNLASVPSLLELDTISFQDEFHCNVSVSPKRRDGRYLFAVTLQPKDKERITPIAQNYTFLIDRSGNVDKTRFRTYRDAVGRALSYLKEGDTFNILLFDDQILKLSHHSVFYSDIAIKNAKKFLASQDRGFGFSTPEIYDLLTRMGRVARSSGQHNTVFLLTSGRSLELSSKRDPSLKEFFLDYQGEYALYTASASHGNKDRILDLISRVRKGEYMHTPTNASFSRKLCSLVRKAGRVIAKNVHVTPTHVPEGVEVILFPNSKQMGDLYSDRPLTIYGLTSKLEDIDLVIQAKSEADWFNIRKTIHLSGAATDDRSIEKEYAFYHSYNSYEKYLAEGLKFYLDEATKMLQIE